MIIERPVEQQAINLVESALNASQMQAPSVALASDVKSILRRYNDKLKQGHGQMLPYIALRDPNNPKQAPVPPRPETRANVKSHISLIIGVDDESQKVPEKPSMFKPNN
ncbi:hypothetical protein ANCDUO_05337 [Ancylostoma duodenale]|uniref:Uncharacterized protein n=1 Tax=Ancylostoma duodenale TaxID=51022 RepID=A0A0C2GYY5_9BILA|nr:hypothetical protein ANCDUO_05337 [Ancylostoma duodenale]